MNQDRNPILDLFRAIAILTVVQVHFYVNYPLSFLNYVFEQGVLGVDIFFVLSGFLVGRIPIKQFLNQENQDFKTFYIKRFFKIIPSFYFAVFAAFLLYNCIFPNSFKFFPKNEIIYYLTFTQNYSASNVLYHAWSLCVEEHFYLLLPTSLFLFQLLFRKKKHSLKVSIILVIVAAYVIRYIGFNFNYETYAATHNRIDALLLGVLLALLDQEGHAIINKGNSMKQTNKWILLFGFIAIALGLILGGIEIIEQNNSVFYHVFYHGLIPLGTFLILSQLLYLKFKLPKWIKLVSYFSYNWYLWHYIIVFLFIEWIPDYRFAFLPYVVVSFCISFFATYYIEEPFMKLRTKILNK